MRSAVGEHDEPQLVVGEPGSGDGSEDVPLALAMKAVDPHLPPVRTRVVRQRHPGQASTVRRSDSSISSTGTGSGCRPLGGPAPRLLHDLVTATLDLTLELVDEQVGRSLVRRGRLAAWRLGPFT